MTVTLITNEMYQAEESVHVQIQVKIQDQLIVAVCECSMSKNLLVSDRVWLYLQCFSFSQKGECIRILLTELQIKKENILYQQMPFDIGQSIIPQREANHINEVTV